jgi:hypothetical protein
MNHWEIIREQAIKERGQVYTSLVREHEYKITDVSDRSIVIDHLTSGGPAIWGKTAISVASERLRKSKRVKKAQSASGAVRQGTLVFLHPCIEWDPNKKELFWVEKAMPTLSSTKSFIDQADDDDLVKIESWVNERKNQAAFRRAVMKIYQNRCAVTGTSLKQVLEAAHIVQHASKGINSNENGILLRADIHRLFDDHLLSIHPETLIIHLHESLLNGEYAKYHGKPIGMPVGGIRPQKAFLETRWNKMIKAIDKQ